MTAVLVERDAALGQLAGCLRAVESAGGQIALVAGEAGIGKTSLLRAFAQAQPHAMLWWGACDALQTPHPLAPLHDIARDCRPRFAPQLGGPRAALFDAVLDELRHAGSPVLLVVEDAHWADDATLDWLKFLGRRIAQARALLAVSYRDDEVGAAHPLRRVLGELPGSLVTRVDQPRLTPAGVETLARQAARPASTRNTCACSACATGAESALSMATRPSSCRNASAEPSSPTSRPLAIAASTSASGGESRLSTSQRSVRPGTTDTSCTSACAPASSRA